jgi:hypothetical protein
MTNNGLTKLDGLKPSSFIFAWQEERETMKPWDRGELPGNRDIGSFPESNHGQTGSGFAV